METDLGAGNGVVVPALRLLYFGFLLLPAPSIGETPHDISPPMDNQLDCELERGVEAPKLIQCHPRCFGRRQSFPVNYHIMFVVCQSALDDGGGSCGGGEAEVTTRKMIYGYI
jgi:hypothetical protein